MESRPRDTNELQRKLAEAHTAYKKAIAQYRKLVAISADTTHLQGGALRDGNLALHQALRIHQQARRGYEAALREFTDSLLSRKTPTRGEIAPVREELLRVALRVLACFTAVPRRVPSESDVLLLRHAAYPYEVGLPVDELAAAIVERERKLLDVNRQR